MPRRALPWFIACVAALAWGYHALVGSFFLRDDFMWLFDSEAQLARPIEFLTTRPSGYLRPFANVFFGLEHLAFGLDPRGYFVVNILLHGWNALWLAVLVRAFGGSTRLAGAAALVAVSLTSAAPGVVWISGLVSLLAVAMILPTIFFYHAALKDGRRSDYVVALVCLALAVCSRESGVLAGLAVLVLELLHVRGRIASLLFASSFWRRMAPFMAAGLFYIYLQIDFLSGGAGTRNALGMPLDYAANVVTSLPALLRPERWGRWLSLEGGLALLAGVALVLGLFRGRRGLVLFAALVGLLLFAFLPTYPLLSKGAVMAGRYRYEATFVAALFVAAVFDTLFVGPRLLRGLAGLGLVLFVTAQLEALPRVVGEDERFAAYADATRLFADELESKFGAELRAGVEPLESGDRRIALVGVPVENLRHLRCQLGVWYDLPFERVQELRFGLDDATTIAGLQAQRSAYIMERTHSDEAWVWTDGGLVRDARPLPAMRKNWRRPGKRNDRSFVQVLLLPRLEAAP